MSSQSIPLLAQEARAVQTSQEARGRPQGDGESSFSRILKTSTADRAPSPAGERPGPAGKRTGHANAPGQRVENHGRIRSAEAHEAASARREARENGQAEPAELPSDTSPPATNDNGGDTQPSSSAAEGAGTPVSPAPSADAETTASAEPDAATQIETSAVPATDAAAPDGEPAKLDAAATVPAQPAPIVDPAAQQLAMAAGIAAVAAETPDESAGPGHALNAPRATPSSKSAAFTGPPGLMKKIQDAGDATGEAAQASAPAASAFVEAGKAATHGTAESAAASSETAVKEQGAGDKPAVGQESFKATVFDLPPPLPTPTSSAQASGSANMTGPAGLPDGLSQGKAQPASTPIAMLPVEIGMRALEGSQRFDIRLHPEEYGRVDVRLDVDNDGGVKAHLLVDRVDTLAMLQRDAKSLERAFEQAGLKTSDGALQFSLSQGGDQGQRGGRQQPDTPPPAWQDQATRSDLQAALRSITAPTGAVDIRI